MNHYGVMKKLILIFLVGICVCNLIIGQEAMMPAQTNDFVFTDPLQQINHENITLLSQTNRRRSNWSIALDFNQNPLIAWGNQGESVYRWGAAINYRIPYTPWATNKKFEVSVGYYRKAPNDKKFINSENAIHITSEDRIFELMMNTINIGPFSSIADTLQFDIYQHFQTASIGLVYPIWQPSKKTFWSSLNLSLDLMYSWSTQPGNSTTYELRFFATDTINTINSTYPIPPDTFGEINIGLRNNWIINLGLQTEFKIWNRGDNSVGGIYLGAKLNGLFPIMLAESGMSAFSVDEVSFTGYFEESDKEGMKTNIEKLWYPMINYSFQLIYKF